jgi:outer membrane protein
MRRVSLPLLLSAAAPLALLAGPLAAAAGPGTMGPVDDTAPDAAYPADPSDGGSDGSADGSGSYGADAEQHRMAMLADLPSETPADIAQLAQGGAPVTALTDALRLAYWTSPAVLAQRSAVKSTDYRVTQARAAFGPKLDYQLTDAYQRDSLEPQRCAPGTPSIFCPAPGTRSTERKGFSTTASAVLTQPLFTFGRNFAAERFSVAQRNFQAQVLRSTETQALFETIAAYVGLLRDRAAVAIASDNLDILATQQADTQARFKVREVTATDVQQVVTRAELARAQLFAAQRDAASSEATFAQKIGAPAGTLAAPNPLDLPVRTLEEAYAYAEANSPVLQAAHYRELVSRAALVQAKADLMPRVDFQGTALYGSQSPYNNASRVKEQRGEVIISGPIYESGLRQAKVGEAKAANDADWRLIDGAVRDNRASLAAAWNDWKAQEAAMERLALSVESAQNALDGARLQQRAGLITTLDVLELARDLLNVRSSYNSSIASAYTSQARVLALMGALEPRWLLPDDPRYNPQVHFDKVKNKGQIPLFTPLMRALDGLSVGPADRRALRDPGTQVETPAVKPSVSAEVVAKTQ